MAELFSMQVLGAVEYRALAKKLRDAGAKDLRSNLNRRIRSAAQEALGPLRDAARSIEFGSENIGAAGSRRKGGTWTENTQSSHRGGGQAQRKARMAKAATTERAKKLAKNRSGSLRETLARNVKVSVTAQGVAFLVPKGIIEGWEFPARDADRATGWRHPVFGKDVWVTEHGSPWFATTLNEYADSFREAVMQAVQDTLEQLGG